MRLTSIVAVCAAALLVGTSAARKLSHIVRHHLVYSAHADLDGDGRPDLVTLRRHPVTVGHLAVKLAGGTRLGVRMRSDAPFVPGLSATGDVNGVRGAELFVDMQHFPTNEVIGVFTYAGGHLRLAQKLFAYSTDFPVRYGITCTTKGGRHRVTQYQFQLHVMGHRWHWAHRVTVYTWRGSALRVTARHRFRFISGRPPGRQVGVHCGRPPAS